jgi:hypothetical protein
VPRYLRGVKGSKLWLIVAALALAGSIALYAKSRAAHPRTRDEDNLAGDLVLHGHLKWDDLPRLAEEYEVQPAAAHDSRSGNLVQDIASLNDELQRNSIVLLAKMRRENQAAYARPWRMRSSYAAMFAAFCVLMYVVSRFSSRRSAAPPEPPPAA